MLPPGQQVFLVAIMSLSLAFGFEDLGSSAGSETSGPWGVPIPRYNEMMNTPNATSNYNLPGPNISLSYPASGPVDGWSWTVSVIADIPITEGNYSFTADLPRDATFTGNQIMLHSPTGSNSKADGSWIVCVIDWVFNIPGSKYPAKFREDDGGCSSLFNEECIHGLEAKAVEQYRALPSDDRPCRCPEVSKVPSCGSGNEILEPESGCRAKTFNATEINDWPDGKYYLQRYGGPPHNPGNLTAYGQTGNLAWPVMVLWGYSQDAKSPDSDLVGATNTTAKMSCLRAKEATPGSSVPGSGVTSGGGRGKALSVIILAAGVLLSGGCAAL